MNKVKNTRVGKEMLNESRSKSSRDKPELEATPVGRRQEKGIRSQEEIKESRALEKKRNDDNDENRMPTESDRL